MINNYYYEQYYYFLLVFLLLVAVVVVVFLHSVDQKTPVVRTIRKTSATNSNWRIP